MNKLELDLLNYYIQKYNINKISKEMIESLAKRNQIKVRIIALEDDEIRSDAEKINIIFRCDGEYLPFILKAAESAKISAEQLSLIAGQKNAEIITRLTMILNTKDIPYEKFAEIALRNDMKQVNYLIDELDNDYFELIADTYDSEKMFYLIKASKNELITGEDAEKEKINKNNSIFEMIASRKTAREMSILINAMANENAKKYIDLIAQKNDIDEMRKAYEISCTTGLYDEEKRIAISANELSIMNALLYAASTKFVTIEQLKIMATKKTANVIYALVNCAKTRNGSEQFSVISQKNSKEEIDMLERAANTPKVDIEKFMIIASKETPNVMNFLIKIAETKWAKFFDQIAKISNEQTLYNLLEISSSEMVTEEQYEKILKANKSSVMSYLCNVVIDEKLNKHFDDFYKLDDLYEMMSLAMLIENDISDKYIEIFQKYKINFDTRRINLVISAAEDPDILETQFDVIAGEENPEIIYELIKAAKNPNVSLKEFNAIAKAKDEGKRQKMIEALNMGIYSDKCWDAVMEDNNNAFQKYKLLYKAQKLLGIKRSKKTFTKSILNPDGSILANVEIHDNESEYSGRYKPDLGKALSKTIDHKN